MKPNNARGRALRLKRRRFIYGTSATVVAAIAGWQLWPTRTGGTASVTIDAIGDQVQTLPKGQLPIFAGTADLHRLYRYAVEHGDELQYVPCFCGCYRLGHKSNRDCYIKAFAADGRLTFTSHAAT